MEGVQLGLLHNVRRIHAPAQPHVQAHVNKTAQRRPVTQANWIRTIHHGMPEKLLTPQPVTPGYLAVLGRIAPEKGVDRAIRIAIRCGIPLKIAAKIDPADQDYYDEIMRPLMDHPLVEYVGEISDHEKSDFLSGANCGTRFSKTSRWFSRALVKAWI